MIDLTDYFAKFQIGYGVMLICVLLTLIFYLKSDKIIKKKSH